MKKLYTIFIIVLNLIANDTNTIMIYTNIDNQPYSYIENDNLKGIYVTILDRIFHKIDDFKLIQKGVDSKESIKDMREKKVIALNGIYHRADEYDFIDRYSEAIFNENIVLMCNKSAISSDKIKFPDEFYDLNISKNKNFSIDSKELSISNVNKSQDGVLKLISGEINCYIDSEFSILSEFQKLKSGDKLNDFETKLTLFQESVYIGFSKKEHILKDSLIKKINLAIRVMKNSGEIDDIMNEYLVKLLSTDESNKLEATTYNWGGSYVSDKFNSLGLIPEIVTLAFQNVDIDVNYNLHSSQYSYLLTKWGKSDFSFPFYRTKDNEKYMLFSDPVMFSEVVLIYSKDKFPNGIKFNSFDDLKEYHIGGVKGYFYEDIFVENNLNYTLTQDFDELIDKLILDKIDVIPSNLKVFIDKMEKKYPDKLDKFIFYNKKNFSNEAIYLIFPKNVKNSSELKELFNKGLDGIKKSDIFEKVFAKYGFTKSEYKTNINKFKIYKEEYKKPQNNIVQFINNVEKEKKTDSIINKKISKVIKNPTIPLYINTYPIDSKIEILDIKERFHQGIKLEKGIYRIRLSKAGYKTLNKKVIIGNNKTVTLNFNLEEN